MSVTLLGRKSPLDISIFTALFGLLVLSFYFVPDQAGRNLFLYATALVAHAFVLHRSVWAVAYRDVGGWVVLLLVLTPCISLLWSRSPDLDRIKDLLVAAYVLLAIYLGVAWVLERRSVFADRLAVLLLLAGSAAGAFAIGHWASRDTPPGAMRLEGLWGIDNPVHASVLLLGGTLPVISQILDRRRSLWWLVGAIVPIAFIALAGSRAAAGAYLIVVLVMAATSNLKAAAGVFGGALLIGAGAMLVLGMDLIEEVWLSRGISFRGVVWEQVWDAYRSCNPAVGCGLATPIVVDVGGVPGTRAHSIFLAALYHQGLLGLVVFLGSLGCLLRRGFRGAERSGGAPRDWSWMLAYVLLANATSGNHVLVRAALFWLCFWLPVMMVAATSRESSLPTNP